MTRRKSLLNQIIEGEENILLKVGTSQSLPLAITLSDGSPA
jgi:hypothetical protein